MQKGKSDVVPLASALSARMSVQGSSVTATAKELGISASYLSQLLAGDKAFGAADDEILRSAATYLKLPPVVCFLLAGRLRHTDFIDPIDHEAELNNALQVIATSSYALEAATDIKTLSSLPSSVKLLLILTYEAAGNCNLISKKKRWPWTAEPLVSEISQLLR